MKLTTFTDYSLRVLMFLATEPDQRATISQIARAYGISEHHLVKVVHFLGKQGWLANTRGKGGGVQLALPANQIGLGAVVRHCEGECVTVDCGDTRGGMRAGNRGGCVIGRCCQLRDVLAEATAALYAVLDKYTLADISGNRQELAQVLWMPRAAQVPGATEPAT